MILLRRGHPAALGGVIDDLDVTFRLAPVSSRSVREGLGSWRPPTEVIETDLALVVRAEIGGLQGGDVDVTVEGSNVVIRGERPVATPGKGGFYHESRNRHGPFLASVHVPFPIAIERAVANYIDGFLTITLPRLAARQITARDNSGAPGTPGVEH